MKNRPEILELIEFQVDFFLLINYLQQQICKSASTKKDKIKRLSIFTSLVISKVFGTDEKMAQSKRFPQSMSRLIKIVVLYVRYSYSFD